MAAAVTSHKRNLKNRRKNSEDDGPTTSSSPRLEKNEKQLSNKKNLIEHNRTSKYSMFSCITFLGLSIFLMLAIGLLLTELHVKQKGMTELVQLYLHGPLANLPVNVDNAKLKMERDVKKSTIGADEDLSSPESNKKEYSSNIKSDPTVNIEEATIKENVKDSYYPIKDDMPVDRKKEIVNKEEGYSLDKLTELESQIIPDANAGKLDSVKKKDLDPGKTVHNNKNETKSDEKLGYKKTQDLPEINIDKAKEMSHSKLLDLYTKVEKLTEDILAQDPGNDMVLQLAPHLAGVVRNINSDKLSGIEESLLHIKEILLDLKERLKDAQGLEKKDTKEAEDHIIDSGSNKIPVDEVIPDPVYIAPRGSHSADESLEQGAHKFKNNDDEDSKTPIGKDTVVGVISDPGLFAPKENLLPEGSSAKVHSEISGKELKLETSDAVVKLGPTPSISEQNKDDAHIINMLPSINKEVDKVEAGISNHNLKLEELEETHKVKFLNEKPVPIKSDKEVNDLKGGNEITPDKTEKLDLEVKLEDSERKVKNIEKDINASPKTAESQNLKLKSDDSIIDSKQIHESDLKKKTSSTDNTKEEGKNIVKENILAPKSEEKIDVFKTEGAKVEELSFVSRKKLEPIEEKLDDAEETTIKINTDKTTMPIKETILSKSEIHESQHVVSDNEQIVLSKIPTDSEIKISNSNEPAKKSDLRDQQIPTEVKKNAQLEEYFVNAETLITKDPARALDIFKNYLLNSPKDLRSLIGKARALDKLAEKEQSNTLLEKSIMAYFDVINLIEEKSSIADKELLKEITVTCIEKLYFRGWRQKVAPLLLKVINHFPNDIKLWNNLGRAYLMTNDNAEALKVFQKVLQSWPDNGYAQVHYGFILKITNKNVTEAIQYLHQGIQSGEEGTSDGRFYLHLGDAYQRMGNNEEAYKVYDDAATKGLFLSKYQRSLHNIDRLKAKPVWTLEETTYSHFFRKLEENWEKIMAEGLSVMDLDAPLGFKPEAELLRKNGEWSQFDLFVRGAKNNAHCAQVPFTCSLIENFSPAAKNKRGQVKFSLLFPGTVVYNHTGPTNCRLRAHLGLITPPGAALKVLNNILTWEAGKIFVFDDSFEHEVWHKGDTVRMILIVDVWHPQITEEEKLGLSPI